MTGSLPASPAGDATPDLSGNAEPGSTVRLHTDDGCTQSVLAIATADGTGRFTFPNAPATANGTTSFRATAADAAGNVSACSHALTYVHDAATPSAPGLTSTTPGSPGTDAAPDVVGTAEPGTTVRLYLSVGCTGPVADTALAAHDGDVAFLSVPVPPDAATTLAATATDAAGNTSPCSPGLVYVHDAQPPAPPALSSTDPPSPGKDTSPDLSGTGEGSGTLRIYVGECGGPLLATQAIGPDGTFTVAGLPLATDATTVLRGTVTDGAGNTSACSPALAYTNDTIPPAAPAITGSTPATPGSDASPQIRGTAESGATVELYKSGDCSGQPAASGPQDQFASGIAVTVTADATTSIRARALDAAGNASPCSEPFEYLHCSFPCEQEPNDSLETANPLTTPGVRASLTAGDPYDFFTFTLASPARVKLWTQSDTGEPCGNLIDTTLQLYDALALVRENDDVSFSNWCSEVSAELPAGTYDVRVGGYDIPAYRLMLTVTPVVLIGGSTPASPARDVTPEIFGEAPPGSTVAIYASSDCTGSPVASGTAAQFASPGLTVTVPADATTMLTARASGPDTACSTPSPYVETASTSEEEPNDTFAQADSQPALSATGGWAAAIGVPGDRDHVRIVLPTAARVDLETFDSTQAGCAGGIDTVLTLFAGDGTQLQRDDQSGLLSCSKLGRVLPAGTYYARVDDYQDNGTIDAYRLQARIRETALITSSSPSSPSPDTSPELLGQAPAGSLVSIHTDAACAGPAAATGSASAFASPGLTVTVATGTATNFYARSDQSGSPCEGPFRYVVPVAGALAEIEPNDTKTGADAAGLVASSDFRMAGSIAPGTDVDRLKLEMPSAGLVRLEAFDTTGLDCVTPRLTIALRSAADTQLYSDASGGIGNCGALVVPVASGTGYLELRSGNGLAHDYLAEVNVQADNGSEAEPNDTIGTATPFGDTTDAFRSGDHSVGSDVDTYAVTLPAARSLRAEVVEGDSETCEGNGVESDLYLFDASGTQLARDDDDGRGLCSRIDGTGGTPADPGAASLAAGTYYLQVRAAPGAPVAASQFQYRLQLTTR